jgi:hypothetical protein
MDDNESEIVVRTTILWAGKKRGQIKRGQIGGVRGWNQS